MPSEKLFRFNPFNIKNWQEAELVEQFSILERTITNGDTPYELSNDIDIYANLGYLLGEMVARYYQLSASLDAQLKVNLANATYRERNEWTKTNPDKAPAMSYFENKAHSMFLDETMKLVEYEANLKRFKYAYDSIESKQNALKKKLESIKFEMFNK
jgi:hypothetical protein